jgi:hypothetical protein
MTRQGASTTPGPCLYSQTCFYQPHQNRPRARFILQRRWSSGVETKNWRVQRLGRPRGIEIFTEERDLAAGRPQEQHIFLAIETPVGPENL